MYNILLFKSELSFLELLQFLVVNLVIKAVDITDHVKPPHELDVLLHPCSGIHGVREPKYTSIPPKNSQKIKEIVYYISIYPPNTMKN
jgi:hypothetical protein